MALLSRNLDWHESIIIQIYYNRNGAKSIKWLRFEDIGIEVLQYIEDLFGAKNNNILRSVWEWRNCNILEWKQNAGIWFVCSGEQRKEKYKGNVGAGV